MAEEGVAETKKLINKSKTIFWWDIENTGLPKGLSALVFVEHMKRRLKIEGFLGDLEVHVVVPFLDSIIPIKVGEGVFHHYAMQRNRPTLEEAAKDPKLMKLRKDNQLADSYIKMQNGVWISQATCHHNVIVSSGDHGFAKILKKLAKSGHTTILLYDLNSVATYLLDKVHYRGVWKSFLFLLPKNIAEESRAQQQLLLEEPILEIAMEHQAAFVVKKKKEKNKEAEASQTGNKKRQRSAGCKAAKQKAKKNKRIAEARAQESVLSSQVTLSSPSQAHSLKVAGVSSSPLQAQIL